MSHILQSYDLHFFFIFLGYGFFFLFGWILQSILIENYK